jgi:hypothetical protein
MLWLGRLAQWWIPSQGYADLTGDGRADILGFGDAGVYVFLNEGTGPAPAPRPIAAQ